MEARARKEHEEGRKTDLFKLMKKHDRDRLTSGIWERALDADDKLAHELIDRAVEAIGTGVASVINVLDVEAVIIGGGLGTRLGEPYAKKIEKRAHKNLFNDTRPPDFRVASLGDLGGAIGASLLGRCRQDPFVDFDICPLKRGNVELGDALRPRPRRARPRRSRSGRRGP